MAVEMDWVSLETFKVMFTKVSIREVSERAKASTRI